MRKKAPAARSIGLDLNLDCILDFPLDYDVELHLRDGIEYLETFAPAGRTVIYCDPPYVHSTRGKTRYKHELSDEDHVRLLEILLSFDFFPRCEIMISGYRNGIYDDMLADWKSIDFQAMTRGGVRTETIWTNFEPGLVHYHHYAGSDYTDRQRIKRKAERWASNYRDLPPGEKQAVLAALLSAEPLP